MKTIKKIIRMITYNIWSLVGFEAIFKLLSFAIFTPLFFSLFDLVMRLTGYKYLTLENIASFLSNPKTIGMLLVLIILMTIYTMFDITTIIIILNQSYQKKKIKVIDAIRLSLKKCRKIFFPTNIMLGFMVLFLIPFLSVGIASSFVSTIKVPEFILEFIMSNYLFLAVMILIIIILLFILLRWLYALHYFVLEDLNFIRARRKSINLGKHNHIKDLLIILIVQFLSVIIYFIFVILGILLIVFINDICDILWLKSFTTTVIWVFIAISFIIFSTLVTPFSYAIISALFYVRKEKKGEEIRELEINYNAENIRINGKLKKLIALILVFAIIGGSIFTYGVYKGKFNLNIEYVRTVEITAHRGSSVDFPENTMVAFREAKNLGANWIELDVQMTKDNQLIVIHDSSFKRTTGVDKNTWELTLEEVKELDAGSFKDKKFQGEKIPTLEEVIIFAKENNIKLNIELKPTGREENFEETVIDLINKYNFKNDCVITSQIYEVLEKVKKYDKTIETVYVMSLAYGNIISLTAADHFSVEATSATSSLVSAVHKEGKKLLVWTINSEENILKMIDLKVDNIITDNITLAKDVVYSSKTSDVIVEFVKLIEDIF